MSSYHDPSKQRRLQLAEHLLRHLEAYLHDAITTPDARVQQHELEALQTTFEAINRLILGGQSMLVTSAISQGSIHDDENERFLLAHRKTAHYLDMLASLYGPQEAPRG